MTGDDFMSQISINNLSFHYDSYGEDIFKNVSFCIDTDWKLGLVGRNGRGKTTFLKLVDLLRSPAIKNTKIII